MSQEMFSSPALPLSGMTDNPARREATSFAQGSTMLRGQSGKMGFAEAARGYVQRNPGMALLLSATAGLFVALLLPGNPTTPPPDD